MANYLLSLQFDINGCTDQRVKNLGGVSFHTFSSLGNKKLRAAYFEPYNMNAGLIIEDSNIKNVIKNKDWSIYFKYKISKDVTNTNIPIIVYKDNETYPVNFLTINNIEYFSLHSLDGIFTTNNIKYTFDNQWHTFYVSYKNNEIKFFIDGFMNTIYSNISPKFDYLNTTIIGLSEFNLETTNFNGYLDDFNIFEGIIYDRDFIPPTEYIYTKDVVSNYHNSLIISKENFEDELIDSIEKQREHTVSRLNEIQRGMFPRLLKFTWYENKDGYFENYNYSFNMKDSHETYINITGIDTSLLTKEDKYFASNMQTALEANKIHPLMIFVNNRFIKLSQIKLVKSEEWYTLIISKLYEKVESINIVLLPFPVIYEEDYGERADLSPLYAFDNNGYFTPTAGSTYYYIDPNKNPHLKQIGIREHYVSDSKYFNLTELHYKPAIKDSGFMRFIWRYGTFEEERRADDGVGAFMLFKSDANGYVKPGDNVLLYKGTTLLNPKFYRVVGYDLIYFDNIYEAGILSNRTITMQIITDSHDARAEMLVQDFTEMKIVYAEATVDKQAIFKIPEVVDSNGDKYRKFLVFKGHVLMEDQDRYIADFDAGEIRLTNREDFITCGRHLTFIFIKLSKADARGKLYTSPVFMYCKPSESFNGFDIPTDVIVSKHNSMVFINGTLMAPFRYQIIDNKVVIEESLPKNANIIVVMLKIISPLEDPTSWRDLMIQEEIEQGKRFVLYDLGIPKRYKITLDNLLCFDQVGRLITDLYGKIYNYNIIKSLRTIQPLETQVRYLTCLYRDDSLENKANLLKFPNETFLKEYIKGREEFYELDEHFQDLMEDFDFSHQNDLSYGENLSKALNYIVDYNQNKIDDVYEKRASIFRKIYDPLTFNKSLIKTEEGYKLSIPNDEYRCNKTRTYPLFFENGKLVNWKVQNDANNTDVILDNKLSSNSRIESINFKGMNNFLFPLNTTLTATKQVVHNIHTSLTVGEQIETYFYADIVVKENSSTDLFPCRIYVDTIFDPTEIRIDYQQDLFTLSITPAIDKDIDIICSLDVYVDPDGTKIDLDEYNDNGNYYDFYSRIEVQ